MVPDNFSKAEPRIVGDEIVELEAEVTDRETGYVCDKPRVVSLRVISSGDVLSREQELPGALLPGSGPGPGGAGGGGTPPPFGGEIGCGRGRMTSRALSCTLVHCRVPSLAIRGIMK